jgi:hypothetical protein
MPGFCTNGVESLDFAMYKSITERILFLYFWSLFNLYKNKSAELNIRLSFIPSSRLN